MATLAHIGHWYVEALYVLPVALVVGWLSFSGWREKRQVAKADARGPATPDRTA